MSAYLSNLRRTASETLFYTALFAVVVLAGAIVAGILAGGEGFVAVIVVFTWLVFVPMWLMVPFIAIIETWRH